MADHRQAGPKGRVRREPTARLLAELWLASLNRWTRQDDRRDVSIDAMIGYLDEAHLRRALVCAWRGAAAPRGP
jgi:hypothetical protein